MSMYDRLAALAAPVGIQPEDTSYWNEPEDHLDPALFRGDELRGGVRSRILRTIYGFWSNRWANAEAWATVWLAGSGASYHWSAARNPGDLDVLVGVDFIKFRQANPDMIGLSNQEIADVLNRQLVHDLWPKTAHFTAGGNTYELTVFVNAKGSNIRDIHAYAAYNITAREWTIWPDPQQRAPVDPVAEARVAADAAATRDIVGRYDDALTAISGTTGSYGQAALRRAAAEAQTLFHEIHDGRKNAYDGGVGIYDPAEYRYKGSKRTGSLKALRSIAELADQAQADDETERYGAPILSGRDALLKAVVGRRYVG